MRKLIMSELDSSLITELGSSGQPLQTYHYNKNATTAMKRFFGEGIKRVYAARKFEFGNYGSWDGENMIIELKSGSYTFITNSEWASFATVEIEKSKGI